MAKPSWRGAGAETPGVSANPFLEEQGGNPFASDSREVEVARVLDEYRGEAPPQAAGPFGSPLSAGAGDRRGSLQDVPLYDSYSSSTHYASPTSSWPSNGKRSAAASPGPSPRGAAFEMSTPPPAKKGGALGKLWGGSGTPPTPTRAPSTGDLSRREADLARREAEVARKEAELRAAGASVKNWPRCWRVVHHDIGGDIPATRQGLVRMAYITWCLIAAGYVWNFVAITAFFIGGEKKVSLWVFSGLVAVAGVPLSFLTWYRSLYFAAKHDGMMRWLWYFLHMLINIVWCVWMFIGIKPNLGGYSAGIFEMITQFDHGGGKGIVFAIMCIINMALFGLGGAMSLLVWGRSMAVFRRPPAPPPDRVRIAV